MVARNAYNQTPLYLAAASETEKETEEDSSSVDKGENVELVEMLIQR